MGYLLGGVDEVASRPSQWLLAFPGELEFSFQNKEVLILSVVCEVDPISWTGGRLN
jgi:hypothetical protein